MMRELTREELLQASGGISYQGTLIGGVAALGGALLANLVILGHVEVFLPGTHRPIPGIFFAMAFGALLGGLSDFLSTDEVQPLPEQRKTGKR